MHFLWALFPKKYHPHTPKPEILNSPYTKHGWLQTVQWITYLAYIRDGLKGGGLRENILPPTSMKNNAFFLAVNLSDAFHFTHVNRYVPLVIIMSYRTTKIFWICPWCTYDYFFPLRLNKMSWAFSLHATVLQLAWRINLARPCGCIDIIDGHLKIYYKNCKICH